jgi:hypothetical protein
VFRWIEEAPVPADSLRTLQRSLDETLTTGDAAPRRQPPEDGQSGGPSQTTGNRSSSAMGRVSP